MQKYSKYFHGINPQERLGNCHKGDIYSYTRNSKICRMQAIFRQKIIVKIKLTVPPESVVDNILKRSRKNTQRVMKDT